eukprot:gnl/Chilomastix_caulleri/2991.p1 GENE.gnl/Chilomastix_caulleri/2991~~gnl/Chilomastix_caulleri/2991.p1  ORF type:complete len:79 (+),score=23.36 gnl/Chilomastix_caulleri/2991:396-632(+)
MGFVVSRRRWKKKIQIHQKSHKGTTKKTKTKSGAEGKKQQKPKKVKVAGKSKQREQDWRINLESSDSKILNDNKPSQE